MPGEDGFDTAREHGVGVGGGRRELVRDVRAERGQFGGKGVTEQRGSETHAREISETTCCGRNVFDGRPACPPATLLALSCGPLLFAESLVVGANLLRTRV